ncbi:hypothetical protein V6N12_049471 [Hibiscus sabdariffa]|uniref:Uncharacterized protein n=1 Tax=Hibiscus sabdariffa TaxID=183260 RepID=A0ABR2CBF2_9ROSI
MTDEEQTYVITIWNNRFEWFPEDGTQIEDDEFNCSPEYSEWFNNNGKPFLVAHEVSQRWHMEQRCSYQLAGEPSEPNQSAPQPPNDRTMDCSTDWSPWPSEREPTRHVVGSSDSSNPWEQPIHRYPTVGGTSYQHTEVSSSGLSTVFKQAHVHTTFGGSSSYHPSHDDDVYIPHFEYPQSSMHGQGMDVQAMTSWLSTTTISSPLLAHSTSPSMQMMDDQLNEDGQTFDHPHPRRTVKAPRRYDQTSSLHRQELPRRRRG